MSEWEKLWKNGTQPLCIGQVIVESWDAEKWLEQVKAVGDAMQATTYIQDEELLQQLLKLEEAEQKLEAIRCVINDPPTYSIPFLGNPAPEVQDYRNRMDAWYCKLLNIAHTAQNTDYVQKEKKQNVE